MCKHSNNELTSTKPSLNDAYFAISATIKRCLIPIYFVIDATISPASPCNIFLANQSTSSPFSCRSFTLCNTLNT